VDFVAPRIAFLGATTCARPRAVIIGAPLDRTESFRSGTREAPERIRAVSDVLEMYSPLLGADLEDVALADLGDVPIAADDVECALDKVAQAIASVAPEAVPILLGGEHTATVGAVRGALRVFPDLAVVQVDAHADLRDAYAGERLSHATVMRRIADALGMDRIVQLGIRSGTREEFALARQCRHSTADLAIPAGLRRWLADRPLYLSVDIDVLDPSCAPGTGCPEPGGATFAELLSMIHSLRGLRVIGVDVMEVLPAADVNDVTSIAAAKLVRECAIAFAGPPRGEH